MSYHVTDHGKFTPHWTGARLGTPKPGTRAALAGAIVAVILITLSQGPAQRPDIADWHGNVASASAADR